MKALRGYTFFKNFISCGKQKTSSCILLLNSNSGVREMPFSVKQSRTLSSVFPLRGWLWGEFLWQADSGSGNVRSAKANRTPDRKKKGWDQVRTIYRIPVREGSDPGDAELTNWG